MKKLVYKNFSHNNLFYVFKKGFFKVMIFTEISTLTQSCRILDNLKKLFKRET